MSIRVTVWNEFRHEKRNQEAKALYPHGIHAYIKSFLECDDIEVTLAALDDPDNGISDELLNSTDVLMWWGHMAHNEVPDELVAKIRERIYHGMGFIPMHSAHHSKVFKTVVGATGNLTWGREQKCVVWNLAPSHPITDGIPSHFELEEELYSEPFYVPQPDELLFASWFEDGNIFRGGLIYKRGLGKIFYFHPGHETCASFHNEYVQRVLKNAVYWCRPADLDASLKGENIHQTQSVI